MRASTFHFPPFHLSSDVDLLYRDGAPVRIEPRAVQVLRYLVLHRDRVVPKEELLDRVWADVFTTDAVLKQAVSQIRRALGETPDAPRYVQTFHARGYRFVAPVHVREAPPESGGAGAHTPDEPPAAETSPPVVAAAAASAQPNYDLLVGREKELSLLKAEYGRALEGGGQPVVVKGEPGIGKTQLARRFGRWARAEGALYVYARFFDYEGSRLAPYEAFIDLLRAAIYEGREAAPVRRRDSPAEGLREAVEARCGERLPDELFRGVRAPLAHVGAGPGGDDHFRVIVPIARAFLRLAGERPLVMVLDDIQWADEVSLDCLGYLMRSRADEPLLLVLLARAEESAETGGALARWLRREAVYRSFTSVSLKPLDEGACREAVEEAFGGPGRAPVVPRPEAHIIHRVTGGNPYFLVETLRLLVAEGHISETEARDEARWEWHGIEDVPLPDSLVMAAMAKLERLSPELRGLLEQAAVIGDEFRVETLVRMSARAEEEVDESLQEGVRLGVLSGRGVSVGEDYRFYHTLLRRVLYDGLGARRRRRLHRAAADAIEEVYARHAERVADALGVHYEAAGDAARAFRWSMRAWAVASASWHWGDAVSCVERARRAAEQLDFQEHNDSGEPRVTPAEKMQMQLALIESLHAVGRNKELVLLLPESLALARSLGDRGAEAALLFWSGLVHIALSQYPEAQRVTEQAREAYRLLGDAERERLSLLQLGQISASMGDYEAAARLIEGMLGEGGLTEATEASARALLGWTRALQGRYAEGVGLFRRALDYHSLRGNVRQRAQVLRRLHWADLSRGQYESAVTLAVRARKDFQTTGDLFGEAKTHMGIGQARIAQGLYDEGIRHLRRTLESLKNNGDAHCEAETLWLLGRAHGEAGRLDDADASLGRALEMIRAIGDRDDEFRILVDEARVRLARRGYGAALSKACEAAKIAEELRCRDGLGLALVEQSHARRELREPDRAAEAAREAVRLLDETGSGERWRGYWALALALDAGGEGESLTALRRAVELLDELRAQFAPEDEQRRAEMTRARNAPARLLRRKLLEAGRDDEARRLKLRWALDEEPGPPPAPAA
ncbi:MAG TPA: AAA family ATPase [Pyrinomonadaceae bacterium]|jgi:DNA-binding winged helix-turn-helix (wHTH) protein/tetratricopeptide (TPR) repeat protein|nr:AAA family ATPase [Pyrinomonadaceae bacterium]